MEQDFNLTDQELHRFYDSCKFKNWVAYLYLFCGFTLALERFYLGDELSRKLAFVYLGFRAYIVLVFGALFRLPVFKFIDMFIVGCFLIYELFAIRGRVRENNFELIKNIKRLEDIKFQNRQYAWSCFAVIFLLINIFLIYNQT